MERLHLEQACSTGNMLRMASCSSTSSSLPDLCPNPPICTLTDESFPCMSGIFDETMDPSFVANGPVAAANLHDQVQSKTLTKAQDEVVSGVRNQRKDAYNSWLSIPIENGHSIDFSMSVTCAQNDHEDIINVIESNPNGDIPDVSCHSSESASCTEKCESGVESKNNTFDMAKDLKERFSGLNLTKPVPNETAGSNNVTFEKSEELQEKSTGLSCTISNDDTSGDDKNSNEKCFNSTADVCGLSNSTPEQSNQKLNWTVDISQSNGQKQEQKNEGQTCSKDCEKQSTFTEAAETNNATIDLIAGVLTEAVQSGSGNAEPVDRTFTKHNTTTDLTPSEPIPVLTNIGTIMIKSCNTDLPVQSNTNCDATVKGTSVSEPSAPVNTTAPVRVDVTPSSDRTLDLPETDDKEVQQEQFRRRNGTSSGEGYLNLDISQSSMFSLDEMIDFKPCPLVASTPIVLGRGFERLGSIKPTNIQKQLSVINSINTQLNDDSAGASEHERSDASKTNQLSVKSDPCSQISTTGGISNSNTSEAPIVNKPLSKLAVRRKIPQPSSKSNIPKTQLPPKLPTLQVTSALVKTKTAAAQALNRPETSSSALHSMRRTLQLNKGKTLASAKNTSTASTVKSLPVTTSTSACNLPTDKKPGTTCMTLPKPSGLQPPGRGRFGLRPPGSAEENHAHTSNKPTGLSGIRTRNSLLPGFSQKHASSDALPLAKRKKTDLQNVPSCAEAPTGSEAREDVQKNVTTSTDITSNIHNGCTNCGNCSLLQEKLHTFHKELGGFLQELDRLPADCKKWVSFQHKLESYLEEVKGLQTDHH